MKESKVLVLVSGGLDSATCLYWAKKKFSQIYAITFDYYGII
jgi:7-cyano-7-deazaguanine synthase